MEKSHPQISVWRFIQIRRCAFVPVLLLMWTGSAMAVDLCPTGMFKYTPKEGPDICEFCYPGSFMPLYLHTERMCYDCTQIQDPHLEILVSPCNKFQDTEIHCIDGYFLTKPAYPEIRGHCQRCTKCPFAKGGCHGREDTLCCPGEEYAVRVNKEGISECVRLCGPGELLDLDNDQCLHCPPNTFMHEESHTNIYCWNCNEPTSENEVVIQSCTSTQPALIGCKEGYYQRSTEDYSFQGCAKCEVCSENTSGHVYEVRGCDKYRDTVCCSEPDMIVVDTPEGPQCQHPATAASTTDFSEESVMVMISFTWCDVGEYLSIGAKGRTATCLPCPVGTCMTETNHSRTNCPPCDDWEDPMKSGQMMRTSGCNQFHCWSTAYLAMLCFALFVFQQF